MRNTHHYKGTTQYIDTLLKIAFWVLALCAVVSLALWLCGYSENDIKTFLSH
jgi:hypothetical protein